jgi:PadR family transcriptional regulator PadR
MRGQGRGGRRRARRRVRMLEPALLLLLHCGDAHGYTLAAQVEEFDLRERDPSVIYRVLRDMEGRRWVTSKWDEEQTQGPPRRVYSLTALGNAVLGQHMEDLQAARERIDRLFGAYARHMEEGEGEHH